MLDTLGRHNVRTFGDAIVRGQTGNVVKGGKSNVALNFAVHLATVQPLVAEKQKLAAYTIIP